MSKQKTIAVTFTEKEILDRAKSFYEEMFGVDVSWGMFLVSLALGCLSVRDIEGFRISCPYCAHVIQAVFTTGEDINNNNRPEPAADQPKDQPISKALGSGPKTHNQ